MLKSALLLLLLLAGRASFSQTLYELSYHFDCKDGRGDCKALINRNDDGTGIIRVAFFDSATNTRNVFEMEMEEHFGVEDDGSEDTTLLIFVGLNPKQITGSASYIADNFVFELSDAGFYEPSFVLVVSDDDKKEIGKLDDIRLLNQTDLTEELVLQYYTQEDEVYQNLFAVTSRGLTSEQKKTQLYLVLVANTNDKKIGKTCVTDKESTLSLFSEVAEFLQIGFTPTVVEGNSFSKVNVEKAINSLKPSSGDIVVFYYSGHGFSDSRDNYTFPYMDLRDKSYQTFGGQYAMNMEMVFQKIKSMGARLNLVISDCCNNDPSQSANMLNDEPNTRTSSVGWNKNKCIELFMNPKRMSYIMTAAKKGELSAGTVSDGGFFTFNFRETLEKTVGNFNKDKTVSWSAILNTAQVQTVTMLNGKKCRQPDESVAKCVQNPVFKSE
ncbi:MAG: caspase family protein [Chitinophagaceae bacterium]|nr:caspase family protein [Chitinophagaceae bacterium]